MQQQITKKELLEGIKKMSEEMAIDIVTFAKEAGLKFNTKTKLADLELIHDRMKGVYDERKKLVGEIVKFGGQADMTMSRKDLNKLYRELYVKANQPANGETPAAGQQQNQSKKGESNMAQQKTQSKQQQKVKGEEKMFQLSEQKLNEILKEAVEKATAPLLESIKMLKEENEAIRQRLAQKAESVAGQKEAGATKEQAKGDDMDMQQREALLAQYAELKKKLDEAHKKRMDAIKGGTWEEVKAATEEYNKIANQMREIENNNPSLREQIAEFFYSAAAYVDHYGHIGVETARKILHKGVDITCNVLNKGVDITAGTLRTTGDLVGGHKTFKDLRPVVTTPAATN